MGGVLEPITEALRTALQRAQGGSIGLTDADLAGDIGALQQVISAATAAQTVRIAQFAARDEQQDPTGPFVEVDLGLGHVAEFAADTLAPMLGMSHGPAQRRVHTAAKLASALPRTMRALADAELDPFRAQLIADELALADRSACAEVEELIHPGVCADTPTQVRRRVRQALASVDPDAVAARAARARLERFVTTRAGQVPGITEWWAHLPAEDSVKCWAAIDALAHRRRQDDPTLTLDQCRADAFMDLILGRTTIETTLTLTLPVQAFTTPTTAPRTAPGTDTDSGPVEPTQPSDTYQAEPTQPGEPTQPADTQQAEPTQPAGQCADAVPGEVPAEDPSNPAPTPNASAQDSDSPMAHHDAPAPADAGAAQQTAAEQAAGAQAANPTTQALAGEITGVEVPGIGVIPASLVLAMVGTFDTRVSRMLINDQTGVTLDTSSTSYRPPAALARHVRLRDGTCRFPGCGVRAERCELDHIVPWPKGPTAVANLLCLCKHHHRLKHHTRWRVVLTPDAQATWTDPFGAQWVTNPRDHRRLAAA